MPRTLIRQNQSIRTSALTDSATITPDADITDLGIVSSLSQNSTFANPVGSPVNGQILRIRLTSSISRTISFGSAYQGRLPTSTTGSGVKDYIVFQYDTVDSKWDLLSTTIDTSMSTTFKTSATLTRSANTTPYIAGSTWGNRGTLALPITGDGNKGIILSSINLVTSLTSLPSGFGSFRAFLFQNTTASANIADNNAFTRRPNAIHPDGYLLNQMQKDSNDPVGRSSTFGINTLINIDSGVSNFYVYLVPTVGYTPAAATADTITLEATWLVA